MTYHTYVTDILTMLCMDFRICTLGEKVYIGRYSELVPHAHWNEKPLFVFGVITPSQGVLTYCDYYSSEKELTLSTSEGYDVVLPGDNSTIFHWKSFEGYTEKDKSYFLEDVVLSDEIGRDTKTYLLFAARVEASVIKESKVVGYYDKSKFPADFDGPLFGVGQAWYDEDTDVQDRQIAVRSIKVHVPHDGKILEVYKFQFLCSTKVPELSYSTYPTINWVTVSDGHLPPNAIAAGVAPNGEVLYIGRGEHEYEIIPGYIVPSEKHLHICYGSDEHVYSGGYGALTIEDQDGFEWGVCFDGEVPVNALVATDIVDNLYGTEEIYIGRTLTGSDISSATTCEEVPINLPHGRVANTQLLGKIHPSHECLYVPWNGKVYIYQAYEVLMLKRKPRSLQDICRHVIITATIGLYDKIDQLPLPVNLKEFCKVTAPCLI